MTDRHGAQAPCTAPELLLKLVLTGTQSHYERRGIVDDKRLEHLLHAGKQILFKSHQESDVRQNLGFSPAIWQGLTAVLSVAIPELEQLCFIYRHPNPAAFNNSSSELVAANCFTLVKEIERLNDLCTIARNLLATTKRAQNLAADRGFDQQILKLIDVCVKVTARGFDGTNVRVEDRHQKVCNLFKRLLITCLQFLHNFIMHNEHRKLVLWLDLFGNAAHQGITNNEGEQQQQLQQNGNTFESDAGRRIENSTASEKDLTSTASPSSQEQDVNAKIPNNRSYSVQDVTALFNAMNSDGLMGSLSQTSADSLMQEIKNDMEKLSGLTVEQLDENPEIMLKVGAALRAQLGPSDPLGAKPLSRDPQPGAVAPARSGHWPGLPDIASYGNLLGDQEITEDDLIMPRTSESAAETLQEAKDELMARLQDTAPMTEKVQNNDYGEGRVIEEDIDEEIPDSLEGSLGDEEEEEEDDEDDYQDPNDQERGLLTDVPLVLGPTEIEALPMIIQAGIVDNFGSNKASGDRQGTKNMQAVRCHILLAQEAGRNVLRELLIFIAAWDLPDDEFYFKMMVQIMEAILKNGLMSHAYSDFGQAKDIISPAQAVVIKILTHIFRSKYSPSSTQNSADQSSARPKPIAALTRVDVLTVRYIFTVFRGNIIPETCALIYLQGQIKAGLAMAEDFPLNLWDMERVYEGVYQFLEFFAVLTENNDWKRLLVEWEIVYDLVTLLKELDASIPKASLTPNSGKQGINNNNHHQQQQQQQQSATAAELETNSGNNAIERPYDVQSPSTNQALSPSPRHDINSTEQNPPATPPPPTPSEDPSTFEWRNLKKLIILVLSSLVWKNPIVQQQIRDNDGVETVLSCTNYDGHNPYIKEHAVMCLKFLLEGNPENQAIVRDLEARGIVDSDGIQKEFGVKASIGDNGKLKIASTIPSNSNSNPKTINHTDSSTKTTSEREKERNRRISRRASESNAAMELLGERFAGPLPVVSSSNQQTLNSKSNNTSVSNRTSNSKSNSTSNVSGRVLDISNGTGNGDGEEFLDSDGNDRGNEHEEDDEDEDDTSSLEFM